MIARLALRHGHGLVDRVGDVLVIGVREVIEELERFVRPDAGGRLDRRQEQMFRSLPRGDEDGDGPRRRPLPNYRPQ